VCFHATRRSRHSVSELALRVSNSGVQFDISQTLHITFSDRAILLSTSDATDYTSRVVVNAVDVRSLVYYSFHPNTFLGLLPRYKNICPSGTDPPLIFAYETGRALALFRGNCLRPQDRCDTIAFGLTVF